MVKKYADLYMEAYQAIAQKEEDQIATLYARNLICKASGLTYAQVLQQREVPASQEVCNAMATFVSRVLDGEPLAYVLEEWDFYGMTLEVDKNVLIPRDDTCAVTDAAIHRALYLNSEPRILDLCTGSGCIGLAIASRVVDAKVTLADVSREALMVAKRNIKNQKLSARVSCVYVDAMYEPPAFIGKFDMIVSNPPYITTAEMENLDASVKDYEPHLALHGGEDGLNFYRAIAKKFQKALKPEGYLCFEFGLGQADAVCEILRNNQYEVLDIIKDYNQVERAVVARLIRKEV